MEIQRTGKASEPDPTRSIDPDALERTIEFLRGEYDYLVLDCV